MTKTVEEEVALLRTLAVEATALRTKIEETPGEISEKDELRMKEQDEEFDRSVNRLATIDPMLAKAPHFFSRTNGGSTYRLPNLRCFTQRRQTSSLRPDTYEQRATGRRANAGRPLLIWKPSLSWTRSQNSSTRDDRHSRRRAVPHRQTAAPLAAVRFFCHLA